jgi:hypothetical protein
MEKVIRKELLSYFIIFACILSGSIFDAISLFCYVSDATWECIHLTLKDVKLFGISLLLFTVTPYKTLKIKAFSFMICLWSATVLLYNIILPAISYSFIIAPLYSVYIFWLVRILLISSKSPESTNANEPIQPYNILFPVSTFRGLLQVLFTPWRDPIFETRLLVFNDNVIGISKKRFTMTALTEDTIKHYIKTKGAVIKRCSYVDIKNILKLVGTKYIIGLRDCNRLQHK